MHTDTDLVQILMTDWKREGESQWKLLMFQIMFVQEVRYAAGNVVKQLYVKKRGYNETKLSEYVYVQSVWPFDISPFQLCRSWRLQGWSTCDASSPPSSLALHPHPLSPASLESLSLQDQVPGNPQPLRWVTWISISNIMSHRNQHLIPGKKAH